MINTRELSRLYEAASRDNRERPNRQTHRNNKCLADIKDALDSREMRPEEFSIRALFEDFVPDGREIVSSWNPRHGGGGVNLYEAGDSVNTAAFSNITGQIVFNKMIEAFKAEEFIFSAVVPTVPTQFNGEKIPGIGGIGDRREVVGEGMPYPNVGLSEDYIETPVTVKRGMIVPVTKEAVFFDRTGLVLTRAGEVGHYFGVGKEKQVIDCIIDENVTAHRYKQKGTVRATYQTSTPWDNTTAAATLVNETDLDEAEQTLAAITDPNTGDPIMNVPKDLIVTRSNLLVAKRILFGTMSQVGSTTDATIPVTQTPMGRLVTQYRLLSSQLLATQMATDTTWYLGDIAKAFAYMENWAMTVVQAPGNSEDEFKRDIVAQFKVSERGATATIEPRVMTKCTVA